MLRWVVTSYLLTATVAPPIYGKRGDLFGRKIVLLTAITIFSIGSDCGTSGTIMELIVLRAVQGLGGAALLSTSLGALLLASILAGRHAGISVTAVLFVLNLAAAAALLLFEKRAAEPILPLYLFRKRAYAAAIGVSFFAGIPIFAATTFSPLYWQSVRGLSPTETGLAVLPLGGGMLAASVLSGQLAAHFNRYRLFPITGSAVAAISLQMEE